MLSCHSKKSNDNVRAFLYGVERAANKANNYHASAAKMALVKAASLGSTPEHRAAVARLVRNLAPPRHIFQMRQNLEHREMMVKCRQSPRPHPSHDGIRGHRLKRQVLANFSAALRVMLRRFLNPPPVIAKYAAVRWNHQLDIEWIEQRQRIQILRQHVVLGMPADIGRDVLQNVIARNQITMLRRIQAQMPRRMPRRPHRFQPPSAHRNPLAAF